MEVSVNKTMAKTEKGTGVGVKPLYMVLEAVFALAIIGLAVISGNKIPALSPLQIGLFILATFRLARTISFNQIAEGLREPFCYTKKDSCGAGENVHAREDSNARYVIGSLIACPICTSVWVSALLVWIYSLNQSVGTVLVYVLAFAGGSEILHWGAELLEWGGRLFRVASGAISPDED